MRERERDKRQVGLVGRQLLSAVWQHLECRWHELRKKNARTSNNPHKPLAQIGREVGTTEIQFSD